MTTGYTHRGMSQHVMKRVNLFFVCSKRLTDIKSDIEHIKNINDSPQFAQNRGTSHG